MTKILFVGDFHGTFPSKFNQLIEEEKIDLVVSNGDYFPFYYRKLWFKHCFGQENYLWEVIGKKKYKTLVLKDLEDGEKALKKLNSLKIPVITITGNIDYTRMEHDQKMVESTGSWDWDEQDFFAKIIKKYTHIKRFDYSYFKFQDLVFLGVFGGTNPGDPKSKNFKKHYKILDNLFKKFSKQNKGNRVVLISHNVPYKTKLDKIGMKAHKDVRGKHFGSRIVRNLIEKYHPILSVGGHIHESKGKQKIGKTLCINPGAAHEGHAAIIELDNGKIKTVKMI